MKDKFATIQHFKPVMKIVFILPILLLSSCCAQCPLDHPIRVPPAEKIAPPQELYDANYNSASNHWLYHTIPKRRSLVCWYDLVHWTTWMLFGNDDEGIFGEFASRPYRISQTNNLFKATQWWCRNPLHNFTHYILGSAQRPNSEFTLLNFNCHSLTFCNYKPIATRNYGCKCSSLFVCLHGGKPFFSLKLVYPWNRKTECYIGWRKNGSFGIKLLLMTNEKNHKKPFSI